MLKNETPLIAGYRAPDRHFRKAEPLSEGMRALPEDKIREVFAQLYPQRSSELFSKLMKAKDELKRLYDGTIDVAETTHSGLRMVFRLEFGTHHRTLDNDVYELVRGMGFELSLKTHPVIEDGLQLYEKRLWRQPNGETYAHYEPLMDHVYCVSEHESTSGDLSKAAKMAEDLLRLAGMLMPAAKADNVVSFSTAKAPKPPQDSVIVGDEDLGAKAS